MAERPKHTVVYVAGPYTIGHVGSNVRKAVAEYGDALLEAGLIPCVPHEHHLWDAISPKPYEEWIRYTLAQLSRCDALVRIPGDSRGADGEEAAAMLWGIPRFQSVADVIEWARAGHLTPKSED